MKKTDGLVQSIALDQPVEPGDVLLVEAEILFENSERSDRNFHLAFIGENLLPHFVTKNGVQPGIINGEILKVVRKK